MCRECACFRGHSQCTSAAAVYAMSTTHFILAPLICPKSSVLTSNATLSGPNNVLYRLLTHRDIQRDPGAAGGRTGGRSSGEA